MTPALEETGVYTAKELCLILKISRSKLQKLQFPSVNLGVHCKRYMGKQIIAILEDRAA